MIGVLPHDPFSDVVPPLKCDLGTPSWRHDFTELVNTCFDPPVAQQSTRRTRVSSENRLCLRVPRAVFGATLPN